MSGTTRSSEEDAQECFDYIVNTHNLYDLLGTALAGLIKRAKKEGHDIERELAAPCSTRTVHLPQDRGPRRMRVPAVPGWLRLTRTAITLAVKDYAKCFADEEPKPDWIKGVDAKLVLQCALDHRDWWSDTRVGAPQIDPKEAKGIKAIIALQALAGITEPEEKARKGWRGMSERDRENTMAAYATLIGES